MATPKKLPSGNWRIRVYSHTEQGKKIPVSCLKHIKFAPTAYFLEKRMGAYFFASFVKLYVFAES